MIWKALKPQHNIKLLQPIWNIFLEEKKDHHWISSSVYNIIPKQLHVEMWVAMCFADFRTRLQWQALWIPHANTEQVCCWHPTVLQSKDNSHCQEHAGKQFQLFFKCILLQNCPKNICTLPSCMCIILSFLLSSMLVEEALVEQGHSMDKEIVQN